MRAAFEAQWQVNKECLRRHADGGYTNESIRKEYAIWSAAWAASAMECAEQCREEESNTADDDGAAGAGYQLAAADCAAACERIAKEK